MKKLLIIVLAILAVLFLINYAEASDEKYDGGCTGNETQGRCADKCPLGTYSMGYNKNGDLICKAEPTGCPYGDSIPLGPDCDKHKPEPEPEIIPTEPPVEFLGK